MRNNFHITFSKPSPGLQAASQDYLGCGVIAVQGATALACVSTLAKRFGNYFTTLRTLLRRPPAIYFHNFHTSLVSVMFQRQQKVGPADIADRSSQPVVPDHPLDVQALHSDEAKSTDKIQGSFVLMILTLIANCGVALGYSLLCFPATVATALTTGQRSLLAAKLRQHTLQVAWIGFVVSIGICVEGLQSYIDTDWRIIGSDRLRSLQFARHNQEPLASLAFDRQRFDLAHDLSVQLDANRSDVLHPQAIASQSDAISVRRKCNAIEGVAAFEFRIAGLCCALHDATKEVSKRFIKPSHRGLSTAEVQVSEVRIMCPLSREPSRTIAVIHRYLVQFVSQLSQVQAGIVKSPMRFECNRQFPFLVGVGEQPILESLSHLIVLLMASQVVVYCSPDEFGIAQSRLLRKIFECGNLLISQEKVDAFHAYIIHTRIVASMRKVAIPLSPLGNSGIAEESMAIESVYGQFQNVMDESKKESSVNG